MRDRATKRRRPVHSFLRRERGLSHDPPDAPLSERVASGAVPLYIIGANRGRMSRSRLTPSLKSPLAPSTIPA